MFSFVKSASFAGVLLASAAPALGSTVLFQDDFDGASTDLNGTTPDVTQGATAWVAGTPYNADGSFVNEVANSFAASLELGGIVNSTKGNSDGIFVVDATLNVDATEPAFWQGIGFFSGAASPTISFSGDGEAWMLRRGNAEIRVFRGTGTDNGLTESGASPNNVAGLVDLQVELDLTGWDGVTNFGDVTYRARLSGGGAYTDIASGALTADVDFNYVGFGGGGTDATIDSFQVTQVPEPGSLALLSLGLIALRRRRG